MAETTFGIAYDGPALKTGRMPVRDLAPALLALGDLFALSSGLLYPELDPVAVKVEATKEGSFFVHLILEGADAAWEQLVGIFGSDEASALTNLRDTVLMGTGLFWLIRTIRGRRVERTEQPPDPGMIRLILDDTTVLEVPVDAWSLFRHADVRKYSREVVEPVGRQGVDNVTFTMGDEETVTIEKDDLVSFAVIDLPQQRIGDSEVEMFVEIVNVAFTRGHKWRVSLGDHVFFAAVIDDDFLDAIERGEKFGKGDMLRCRIEVRQSRDAEGLHTEYTIIEVLEHRPRPQLSLMDEPNEDA